MDVFVSVVVGRNTYRLIKVAHALLVGPAILQSWVAPIIVRRGIRHFASVTLERGGKRGGVAPCFVVTRILIGRWFDVTGGLAICRGVGRRSLNRLPFSPSIRCCSRSNSCSWICTTSATTPGTWPLGR